MIKKSLALNVVLIGLKALNDCINNCHYGDKSSRFTFVYGMLFVFLCVLPAQAAITIPGADGSDGALEITATTVIDLSEAVTGVWDADNSANAGKGIYDPQKWAVVFKYSSVTIDAGATLSFSNHPSRAPVVWLVNGDVTIDGAVNLNGQRYQTPPINSEPGPGGFRGGTGYYRSLNNGAGFGPGGGGHVNDDGASGSYGTSGSYGPLSYGNQSLIPLIGGSGGSGARDGAKFSGGAGGGAILIACQSTLTVNGIVQSNGGSGYKPNDFCGSGSGGGIRLIADTLAGNGKIHALGGGNGEYTGGFGRICIERVLNNNTLEVLPEKEPIDITSSTTATIWPPYNAPKVKILSIGGKNVPDDPRASFGTDGADVVLPEVSSTQVVVETKNVEQESQVIVRVTPRFNASYIIANATVDHVDPNDPTVIYWVADLSVNVGYSAVQVKVVRP